MNVCSSTGILAACAAVAMILSPATVWAATESLPATEKFEQAVKRTQNLHLPLNRAYLYRQAAGAIAQRDKGEAVVLFKRALSEIEAADLALRATGEVDEDAEAQLEAGRRSTILQLLRTDSAEAMRLLAPPQAADNDMDLQRQIFERAGSKSVDLVRDAAQRKLEYGVTPAVVAAYDVLRRRDAGSAKSFGTFIVFRLKSIDPAQHPQAVTSAFALLRTQQNGTGRNSKVSLSASLLDADDLNMLYEFIGNAFLEALDPDVLALKEKPAAYMVAMQQYAPEKADELAKAVLAASSTSAQAAITAQNTATSDNSDAQSLTPEEQKQLNAARNHVQLRLAAQIQETATQTKLLSARISQTTLSQAERDDALFAIVEEINRSISLGRVLAKDLDPEAFKNGELEFYSFGLLANVVESASSVLQRYALEHPDVAEDAASRLDGPEVQTEVELQIAIREMNRRGDSFPREREHHF